MSSARRLAAIMFTDMVGSTAAAQTNEAEALRLRDEHEEIVRPVFAAHGGRVVKSLGDGLLVVFDSALRAVECAIDVQDRLRTRNSQPGIPAIRLRIGIHLGDVEERAGDIFGDAVNVAARTEPLAEPGGICVSESVFVQVRNKVPNPIEKLEAKTLKGVIFPMDLYRVRVAGTVAETPPTAMAASRLDPSRIVVLPFTNISPDPADEYFADGMTEELIERLAHVSGLRVIARTTAMHYKNSHETALEIGRALSVGSVAECSVRRAGTKLRITAQLIDTRTEEHLWSAKYDRQLDDVFAIQEEIASRIAQAISDHFASRDGGRAVAFVPVGRDTQDMVAYTEFLHGRKLLNERGSERTIREALRLFESAARRDPKFARARVGIAEATLWLAGEGAESHTEGTRRTREELAKALELNEGLAEAHSVLSGFLLGIEEYDQCQVEARRAIALNPSLADPYRWLAQIAAGAGRIDESVRLLETAQQIDPLDINVLAFLGRCYFYSGREQEALAHWDRTKSLVGFRTYAHYTEYYLSHEEYAKAEESLREMERIRPTNVWVATYRGFLAARQGHPEVARQVIEEFESRTVGREVVMFMIGFVRYGLGDIDGFWESIERSRREGAEPVLEVMYSPLYRLARTDPRYEEWKRHHTDTIRWAPAS